MEIQEYFDKIDIHEIERFICEKQEENLSLEFKTVVHPNFNDKNKDDDKKNISKTLSGFANSNGGIIVWGIKAKENDKKQDVAFEKKPITELTKFLNTLNRLEGIAVTPTITGIKHKKIEISEDIGFIISYIPESNSAPHMANFAGKHYYKRSGDSFYQCEHFDIRDMFQRKKLALLDISLLGIVRKPTIDIVTEYETTLCIRNDGSSFARAAVMKIEINYPYRFSTHGINGNGGVFDRSRTLESNQICTYLGGMDSIIHPELEYKIDTINITLPNKIQELPNLILKYFIAAENMEKFSSVKEYQMKI